MILNSCHNWLTYFNHTLISISPSASGQSAFRECSICRVVVIADMYDYCNSSGGQSLLKIFQIMINLLLMLTIAIKVYILYFFGFISWFSELILKIKFLHTSCLNGNTLQLEIFQAKCGLMSDLWITEPILQFLDKFVIMMTPFWDTLC